MPKMKTHKGLKKRVRVTARGKVKHRRAGSGHLLSHKTGKHLRILRQPKLATPGVSRRLLRALCEESKKVTSSNICLASS